MRPASADSEAIRLRRVVTVPGAISFLVCTVIGSGIFVSPRVVLLHAGSPAMALAVWAATGVVSGLSALCYAELALTFPSLGSDYHYIRQGFGDLASFLHFWLSFVFSYSARRAVVAMTFATYLSKMFWPDCEAPLLLVRLLSALALALLTALQIYGSRTAINTSIVFTVAKLTGLGLVMCMGVAYPYVFHRHNLLHLMRGSSTDAASYVLAFYGAWWAYNGIYSITHLVEEIREPLKRNLAIREVIMSSNI